MSVHRAWLGIWALLMIGLMGCGPSVVQTVQTEPHQPHGEDCSVSFETSSATDPEPFPGYNQIGILHVQRSPMHWTDDLEDQIRPEVCEMGGDLVSIVSAVTGQGGDTGTVTMNVYRRADDDTDDGDGVRT